MNESRDNAVPGASGAVAAPPNPKVLEIRAAADDAIFGPATAKKASQAREQSSPRSTRFPKQALRVALMVGLFALGWASSSYVSSGRWSFLAAGSRHQQAAALKGSLERAEILRTIRKTDDDLHGLKANIEALRAAQQRAAREFAETAQKLTAKERADNESVKAGLADVQTKSGAAVANLAAKVERLERKPTPQLVKAPRRHDAFDPSENPGAPGSPRLLGTLVTTSPSAQSAY